MCLSAHTFFPPNKHFTRFTASHLYVEIRSYTADEPGPSHWRLVPGGQWPGLGALTALA